MLLAIFLFLVGLVLLIAMLTTPAVSGASLDRQQLGGQWRVRYADGSLSQPFNRATAEDYRKVFGGVVIPK